LILTNLQFSQAGTYRVVVSNAFGSATNDGITLDVDSLIISQQPQNQTVARGGSVAFTIRAQSLGPVYYQWQWNGIPLVGQTNATLLFDNLMPAQSGNYRVVASNAFKTVTSVDAILSVIAPPPLVAWGINNKGQTNAPAVGNVVALAASGASQHILALKSDSTVTGWGDNTGGQLNVPAGLTGVAAIVAGTGHSVALKTNGTVAAWGDNTYRQLNIPTGLSNVIALAAGAFHTLALKSDGTVVAWGAGEPGLYGTYHHGQSMVPLGLTNVTALAAGAWHSLALKADGTVVAWGDNADGQCAVPAGLSNVVAIAGGSRHSLAVKSDGTVVAWGNNDAGQLVIPAGLSNVVAVVAGASHNLALDRDGTLTAWGGNEAGETNLPGGINGVIAMAAGNQYSVVATADAPFVFVGAPRNLINLPGSVVAFRAPPILGWPARFQWYFNNAPLTNATNITLTLTNLNSSQAGLYRVAVTNAFGLVTSGSINLCVGAVVITSQPQSQTVFPGDSVSFRVAIETVALPVYQWFKAGVALADDGRIQGANSPVLSLAAVQTGDYGQYQVRVTNNFGGVWSQSAALIRDTVRAGVERPDNSGELRLWLHSQKGKPCVVQASTNLSNWEDVRALTNQTGTIYFSDQITNRTLRFYRLRQE
jgi:hypothetical protein